MISCITGIEKQCSTCPELFILHKILTVSIYIYQWSMRHNKVTVNGMPFKVTNTDHFAAHVPNWSSSSESEVYINVILDILFRDIPFLKVYWGSER